MNNAPEDQSSIDIVRAITEQAKIVLQRVRQSSLYVYEKDCVNDILNMVYTYGNRILKTVFTGKNSMVEAFRLRFNRLNHVAMQLDEYDSYIARQLRAIASQLLKLLPEEFVQPTLFEVEKWLNKYETDRPLFECFKEWLREYEDKLVQKTIALMKSQEGEYCAGLYRVERDNRAVYSQLPLKLFAKP